MVVDCIGCGVEVRRWCWQARGNEAYNAGQYEEAVRFYGIAIELCPDKEATVKATLLTNRAEGHRQLTQMKKVVEDCGAALELQNTNTKVLYICIAEKSDCDRQ